jgi:hypothetical protein
MTHCLPLLLYGIDSVALTNEQVRKLSVAFNTVFRRVFHMLRSSSMRVIYNFWVLKHLTACMNERFLYTIRNCCYAGCNLLRLCSFHCNARCWDLFVKYDVHLHLPCSLIKKQVWNYFTQTLS